MEKGFQITFYNSFRTVLITKSGNLMEAGSSYICLHQIIAYGARELL